MNMCVYVYGIVYTYIFCSSSRTQPFGMRLIKLLSADQKSDCHQCGLALGNGIEPAKGKLSRSLDKIKTMAHGRCLKMHGKQKVRCIP